MRNSSSFLPGKTPEAHISDQKIKMSYFFISLGQVRIMLSLLMKAQFTVLPVSSILLLFISVSPSIRQSLSEFGPDSGNTFKHCCKARLTLWEANPAY